MSEKLEQQIEDLLVFLSLGEQVVEKAPSSFGSFGTSRLMESNGVPLSEFDYADPLYIEKPWREERLEVYS